MQPLRLRSKILISSSVLACLPTSPVSGQAPVITPAGDPSVDSDTIYALAVDPASHTEEAVVYLFDDGVVRLDAVGRGTRTYRHVIQVLGRQAVAGIAERRLRYSPDRQKLTVNWVRVLSSDGDTISEGAAQLQESDVPASLRNPVYVNSKEVRISLGGVSQNTIVDLSYTIEEMEPFLEGDSYSYWSVSSSAPVLRSRFVFEVPDAVHPRITEGNLDFSVQTQVADGRRTFVWATADVPRYRPEPFSPDTNSAHMHVIASLPVTWPEIAAWYNELSSDRYDLSPDAQARVRDVVRGAATRLDTIRAVHRWIAQDIRYVSVSLGLGGFQPRIPDEVVTTGFGDCKDKTTLFIAALRSLRIDAYPVLLNINASAVRPQHPSIHQFNHMIAAVRDEAGYTYTDLTAAMTPYGETPALAQGGFAVIVLPDGKAENVSLPKAPPDGRRIRYDIVTTMSEDGLLSGYMEETDVGHSFEARRSLFSLPLDSARAAAVMRGLLGILPGATGDSIVAFDGRDLYAPLRYRIYFSGARGTARTGGVHLFTFPFGVLNATNRIRAIERLGERKASIVAEEVLRPLPPTSQTIEMRVTLPEGWRARVPDDVIVDSDFGTYATEYSQEGRVLRIVRTESSAVGLYPPSRLPDVLQFFRDISADENNRSIVIEADARHPSAGSHISLPSRPLRYE